MTTPNIEELIAELQQLANEIEISYRIESIEEAVKALQSQAERINELERESETHAVIAMLQAYGAACAAHARERALSEAIAICRRNAQNTSADELEALKGK